MRGYWLATDILLMFSSTIVVLRVPNVGIPESLLFGKIAPPPKVGIEELGGFVVPWFSLYFSLKEG